MNRTVAIVGATTASLVVGFALLMFAPSSCACLDPVQDLAGIAGLDINYSQAHGYSATEIEKGLNSTLVGKIFVTNNQLPVYPGCTKSSTTLIKCRVVTNGSLIVGRVFDIRIVTKPDGAFVNAQVKHSWAWL